MGVMGAVAESQSPNSLNSQLSQLSIPLATQFSVTVVAVLVSVHVQVLGPKVRERLLPLGRGLLQRLRQMGAKPADGAAASRLARLERELEALRITVYSEAGCPLFVQVMFVLLLIALADLMHGPAVSKALQVFALAAGYLLDFVFLSGICKLSPKNFWIIRTFEPALFCLYLIGTWADVSGHDCLHLSHQSYLLRFGGIGCMHFVHAKSFIAMTVVAECVNIVGTVYVLGTDRVSGRLLMLVAEHILWTVLSAAVGIVLENLLRARIQAGIESRDDKSMIAGFRQVLKGVCDGDILLDNNLRIMGQATCLKRLLRSSEDFAGTPFSRLLDSAEAQQKFAKFLEDSAGQPGSPKLEGEGAAPAALRLALALPGEDSVSVDIFHTRLPPLFGSEEPYHLLAFVQDGESRPPLPSAGSIPSWLQSRPNLVQPGPASTSAASSRASETNEILFALQELEQLCLCVDTQTGEFDVLEAHAKFVRKPGDAEMKVNMPTLRQFAPPTGWHKLQSKLQSYAAHLRSGGTDEPKSIRSQLLRVPGAPRKYLKARKVELSCANLPGDVGPDIPLCLYVLFREFDKADCEPLPEPRLEGLAESRSGDEK